jgi:hypothetical protein
MNTLRIVLILIVTLLAAAKFADAQDDHFTDSLERIDSMKLALGSVTYFDGKRIELVFIGRLETRKYTFEIDQNSALDISKDFKPKDHRNELFWVVYCNKNHAKTGDETVYYPYILTKAVARQVKK